MLVLQTVSVDPQLHPDARDLYNVNGNLRKVCQTLKDPKIRLNEIEITLFSPFKPVSKILISYFKSLASCDGT